MYPIKGFDAGMFLQIKKVWKKAVAIIALGLLVSFLMGNNYGTAGGIFISDALFTIGMAFFFWGLIHLIGNMGMFTSLKYGAKCLLRVITNRKPASGEMRDGYIEYAKSRPRHEDVPVMMLFTAGFISLSVIAAFVVA